MSHATSVHAAGSRRGSRLASQPAPPSDAVRAVEGAVVAALARREPVVLAVSGGLDSMTLLEAAAEVARDRIAAVATFDHGSGTAATAAAVFVEARARALGLPVVVGRAPSPASPRAGEAEWRRARWRFLRRVAAEHGARGTRAVATAHTEDDQVETVFMRVLRGSGTRGLAALYAPSPVVRPFLGLGRATLAAYAAERGVKHVEDPTNRSRLYLRNRVRLDLLPALERVRPGFSHELLAIARRAADWREEMERLADAVVARDAMRSVEGEELRVGVRALEELDAPSLAVLWPVLAARRGVTLDRRGTRRLAEFTIIGKPGGAIQLAGEVEVVRRRDEFVLRPLRAHTSIRSRAPEAAGPPPAVSLDGTAASLGAWRFEPVSSGVTGPEGAWRARLPAGAVLTARPWRAGDRMRVAPGGAARRVKRFFGDARVAGVDRAGWPVVLVDGEIVWIPGVRRAAAATVPSGQPGLCYACYKARERNLD